MGGSRVRTVAVAVLLVSGVMLGVNVATASPAAATGNGCGWTTQAQMADQPDPPCRSGFVFDPAVGNLMNRSQLMSAAGLYEAKGFSLNFLWYAPDEQLQLSAGNPTQWSDCSIGGTEYTGPTPCPSPAYVVPPVDGHTIDAWDFNDATATLDTWSWPPPSGCTTCEAPSSIFKVCGNYVVAGDGTSNPPPGPSPVPTITGSKYSDLNSDDIRESDEPGVPGWPMMLTRVSSYFQDQPTGYVTTVYTDDSGNYSIPLDGIGPGTYEITEGSAQYWHPDTGMTRTVVVEPGIGDATIAVSAFGNHYNLPPVAEIAPVPPTDQTSAGGAQVALNGSGSYDPDDSIVSWTWTGPFGTATGPTPTVTMPPGTSTVTLTVSDGERTDSTSAPVIVLPPILANAAPLAGTEGGAIDGTVATFTDPDPDAQASEYVATVDWGDGSSPSQGATIVKNPDGTFSVQATHTYAEEADYSPTVTITDTDNAFNTAVVVDSSTVWDAILSPGWPGDLTGTEGTSLNGIVGSFADANPDATAADFTATVAWGDGSQSTGTVEQNPDGSFSVAGSHTYREEGVYVTDVSIEDDGGSSTSVLGQVVVGDAALTATGGEVAMTGTAASYSVATFTDANPYGTAADFSAIIDWGDGTVTNGSISGPSGGPFTVTGSHTCSTLGPLTINVYIVDDGSQAAQATDPAICFATSGFVVGDQTVGLVTPGPITGGPSITYWGSQWWKENALSGGVAPASFKGYDGNPGLLHAGDTWSTGPGNSSEAPPTVPAYMAVVVSSSITKSGSVITGNIVHVVIVKTDAGYAPDPGHAGTGTVVWDLSST
jgi:hypothetical protein